MAGCTLTRLLQGSLDDRLQAVFKVYDINNDGELEGPYVCPLEPPVMWCGGGVGVDACSHVCGATPRRCGNCGVRTVAHDSELFQFVKASTGYGDAVCWQQVRPPALTLHKHVPPPARASLCALSHAQLEQLLRSSCVLTCRVRMCRLGPCWLLGTSRATGN